MNILTVNLLLSTFVFWVISRIYLLPRLGNLRPGTVLLPILLLHAFRHLGLMFLSSGGTYPGMPRRFATPAALGDLLAAALALIKEARFARLLVWIFNIEGSLDLLAAITLATVNHAAPFMGAAYWIPALGSCPARNALHHIHSPD